MWKLVWDLKSTEKVEEHVQKMFPVSILFGRFDNLSN